MRLTADNIPIMDSYSVSATSVFANRARFENIHASFAPMLRRYSATPHSRVCFVLWVTQGVSTVSYDMSGVQIMSILMGGLNSPLTVFLPIQPAYQ